MKKIFYILASAIVALGAVACENDVMDNIATVEGDTVSFVAAIDDTKTDLTADNKTIWDEDDTISITWTDANGERTDVFSNNGNEDKNKFTCTADGLAAIVNAEVVATYSNNGDGKIDSAAGTAGALLTYNGSFEALSFTVENAFLKFTAAEGAEVKLTASAEIFSTGNELTLTATGEAQYVAILPATTTITYAIDGVVCTTSKENALAAGKIYALGTLDKVVTIKTKEDLFAFAEAVNTGANTYDGYTVQLANNIDLNNEAWTPVGNLTDGVSKSFRGNFDGQNNTISNFTVTASEAAGFFGAKWDGDIKNVKFDGATIKGNHFAGVIVGWADGANYNYNWSVEGCEVTGSTVTIAPELVGENYDNGDKAGALVGYAYGINVKGNTVANTTIQGYRDLGGLVGIAQENTTTTPHSEWAVVSGNTLGENVKIVVDNTHNYKGYTIQSHYNVQPYAGRISDCSVVELNEGEATIEWGEIPEIEKVYVAQVGDNKFETIEEAIAAAEGSTIELLADAGDVTISQACTINAGNYTINITPGEGYILTDNGDGTYTVAVKTYKVYVTAQPKSSAAEWTIVNLYTWDAKGNNTWPGQDITANTEVINGYTYNYFEYPAEWNGKTVNCIVNNGTNQTPDIELGVLDKDYYVVYSTSVKEVYTEAPAAGSIAEYVAPVEKKMLYMKDSCGWSSDNAVIYAYIWNPSAATWIKMSDEDEDKIYECELPSEGSYKNIIFVRKSKEGDGWTNVWNQTADLTLPTDGKNMWTMTSFSNGSWSTK